MQTSRALLTVLGELKGGVDPAFALGQDLRAIATDMRAAITALEQAKADDEAQRARTQRLRTLRQLITTLGALELQWQREL